MRVLHVSKVTGIAGSEGHLLRLLPGLRQQGIDARMLVLVDPHRPVPAFLEALQSCAVPAASIAIRGHIDTTLMRRLVDHLRALQPDLVHTHLLHADLYGLPAARQAGVLHAVSSRHNDDRFRRFPAIRWLNQRAMRHADRVIAISGALTDFVREVEGIDPNRLVTVHYGLDAPVLPPDARAGARALLGLDDQPLLVGFFGRLIRQKGVDVLLDAFWQVRQNHPGAQLVIVGNGPERKALESQSDRLLIREAVRFTGWVEGAYRLMPACDVIAVPSRWEGFGLVTLEAMGCSVPLVASRASALPEIVVDGETGLLVAPGDAAELAGALNRLLSDSSLRIAMGQAGLRRLQTGFSVRRMVDATLDVYRSVLSAA